MSWSHSVTFIEHKTGLSSSSYIFPPGRYKDIPKTSRLPHNQTCAIWGSKFQIQRISFCILAKIRNDVGNIFLPSVHGTMRVWVNWLGHVWLTKLIRDLGMDSPLYPILFLGCNNAVTHRGMDSQLYPILYLWCNNAVTQLSMDS